MLENPLSFFTDAVLRGPTIGCMLMCLAAAIVGVILFLRKQSLLGEVLSHAAYPGVILGVIVSAALTITDSSEWEFIIFIMIGAFITALAGLWSIHLLERKLNIRSDSALCFVLSIFFGIGITLASQVQFSHTSLYRQAQNYLYGQAATMTDLHIAIYGILSLGVVGAVALFYKELKIITFNRDYAKSLGIKVRQIDTVVFTLTVLSVVIGIRSVGVVLMSAMLIAPAASARQYTNKMERMLLLAALFGLFSGFFGNYLSVEFTHQFAKQYPGLRLAFPTGPMIILVASAICILSLFFAPKRGYFIRLARTAIFRDQCLKDSVLKYLCYCGSNQEVTFEQIAKHQQISKLYLKGILMRLIYHGFLESPSTQVYRLTEKGKQHAEHVERHNPYEQPL